MLGESMMVEEAKMGVMSEAEAKALWERMDPFLLGLYAHCEKLGLRRRLEPEHLEGLSRIHGVEDLNMDPGALVTLVNFDMQPVVAAANFEGEELRGLMERTGLEEGTIRMLPWPMALTVYHLLGMQGMATIAKVDRLYPGVRG